MVPGTASNSHNNKQRQTERPSAKRVPSSNASEIPHAGSTASYGNITNYLLCTRNLGLQCVQDQCGQRPVTGSAVSGGQRAALGESSGTTFCKQKTIAQEEGTTVVSYVPFKIALSRYTFSSNIVTYCHCDLRLFLP